MFADLRVADAEDALAKAEMAHAISPIIAKRHLTQRDAARLLGIDQPKVSALVRGRLTGFSIDRLLRFLGALDRDVEIIIRPKPRRCSGGRVNVVAVRTPMATSSSHHLLNRSPPPSPGSGSPLAPRPGTKLGDRGTLSPELRGGRVCANIADELGEV